jgi:hypothetical protein
MSTTITHPILKIPTLYGDDIDIDNCYIDRISNRHPFPTPQNLYELRGLASWRRRLSVAEHWAFETDLYAAVTRFNNGEDCGTPPTLPPGYYTRSISAEFDFPWNPGGCEYMKNSYQRLCEMKSGNERTAFDEALVEDALDFAISRKTLQDGDKIAGEQAREALKTRSQLSAITMNATGGGVELGIDSINYQVDSRIRNCTSPGGTHSYALRRPESSDMTLEDWIRDATALRARRRRVGILSGSSFRDRILKSRLGDRVHRYITSSLAR